MAPRTYVIVSGGMGNFLEPPGHPNHDWHIQSGETTFYSLTAALDATDVPDMLKADIQKLLDNAQLDLSEEWIQNVYRHHHNCYLSPDGERVSRFGLPEQSEAAHIIRRYDPDHTPRTDLL